MAADFFLQWLLLLKAGQPAEFTRNWEEGKASAFATAYAANVALLRHGPDFSPYLDVVHGFEEAAFRVEKLIQLEQQSTESPDGHLLLVERAAEFPGNFY